MSCRHILHRRTQSFLWRDFQRFECPANRRTAHTALLYLDDLGPCHNCAWMSVEGGDECLQPARKPDIMIAGPRKVWGLRVQLTGEVERLSPVLDEPAMSLLEMYAYAVVQLGISPRNLRAGIAGAIVNDDDCEVRKGLREQRVECSLKMALAVKEGQTENGARRQVWLLKRLSVSRSRAEGR
jgi:hypothetical protein